MFSNVDRDLNEQVSGHTGRVAPVFDVFNAECVPLDMYGVVEIDWHPSRKSFRESSFIFADSCVVEAVK